MASSKSILTLTLIALVALAFTGCSDDNPTAVTVDTAPPAVPANLDVAYADGAATLTWAANNVDSDLAGYVVVREKNGNSVTMTDFPAMTTSFVDPSPLVGASEYHIYAVDAAGNQSAVATAHLMISLTHPMSKLTD